MGTGEIIYYDYEHCRSFLETRARDLSETATGLETLATFREMLYGFAYEALEQSALVLGQFDTGVVFLFVPWNLSPEEYPKGHEIARAKALELLGSEKPPLLLELLAAQSEREQLSSKGFMEKWMRPEFLTDMLLAKRVAIELFFDGVAFYTEVMRPQLEKHGFEVISDYQMSAESGIVKVRHPNTPGKVYKLPWVAWVREMMGGGYNVIYLMACFATYLQKMDEAVARG